MKSYSPSQVEWYLQTNSIRFFALVVHAETVEHVYLHETPQKAQYEELFKTMLDRVGKSSHHCILLLLCDECSRNALRTPFPQWPSGAKNQPPPLLNKKKTVTRRVVENQ